MKCRRLIRPACQRKSFMSRIPLIGENVSQLMRKELSIFLTAVMFFTRLPIEKWAGKYFIYSASNAEQVPRYFPLVGLLIGVLISGVFNLLIMCFPLALALLLTLSAGVLLTGAFHEDGFADMCDGLGGGWEKQQVLTIMKDSRLGTYGSLGLMLLMALKFTALLSINLTLIPLVFISGHILSRSVATSLIYSYDYVQDDDVKKINGLSMYLSGRDLSFILLAGLLSLCWLPIKTIALIIVVMALLRFISGQYLHKRIGGYTGDCLGGVQQLSEVAFYLLCVFSFLD